jgi:hypothetical protein
MLRLTLKKYKSYSLEWRWYETAKIIKGMFHIRATLNTAKQKCQSGLALVEGPTKISWVRVTLAPQRTWISFMQPHIPRLGMDAIVQDVFLGDPMARWKEAQRFRILYLCYIKNEIV